MRCGVKMMQMRYVRPFLLGGVCVAALTVAYLNLDALWNAVPRSWQVRGTTTAIPSWPTGCENFVKTPISLQEASTIKECVQTYDTKIKHRATPVIKGQFGHMEVDRFNGHTFLTSNSTVLEVGGFHGIDAKKLYDMFKPNFIILEPVPHFFKVMEEKFKGNPKFTLLMYGLGRKPTTLKIPIQHDGTSLFRSEIKEGVASTEVQIKAADAFFRDLGVGRPGGKAPDLLVMNCEGCEFELLETLIETGVIHHLPRVQMQFHIDLSYVPSLPCRYCQIQTLLARTHAPTFHYFHTWQAWHRK